jgi:hypothetical protein
MTQPDKPPSEWAMKKASAMFEHLDVERWNRNIVIIARALDAARAEEAEECAKVCEAERDLYRANQRESERQGMHGGSIYDAHGALACEACAEAIRNRHRKG